MGRATETVDLDIVAVIVLDVVAQPLIEFDIGLVLLNVLDIAQFVHW